MRIHLRQHQPRCFAMKRQWLLRQLADREKFGPENSRRAEFGDGAEHVLARDQLHADGLRQCRVIQKLEHPQPAQRFGKNASQFRCVIGTLTVEHRAVRLHQRRGKAVRADDARKCGVLNAEVDGEPRRVQRQCADHLPQRVRTFVSRLIANRDLVQRQTGKNGCRLGGGQHQTICAVGEIIFGLRLGFQGILMIHPREDLPRPMFTADRL